MKKEKPKVDEFGNHLENLIGFIIDVDPIKLPEVKVAVQNIIKNYADRAYVQASGCTEVPLRKGEAQSTLLNLKGTQYNLGKSLKIAIQAINKEQDEDKILFIITNQADALDEYECMKAVASDKDHDIDIRLFYYPVCEMFKLTGVNKTEVKDLNRDLILSLDPDFKFPQKPVAVASKTTKKKPVVVEKVVEKIEKNYAPSKINLEDMS